MSDTEDDCESVNEDIRVSRSLFDAARKEALHIGCMKRVWRHTKLVALLLDDGHLLLQRLDCHLEVLCFGLTVLNGLVQLNVLALHLGPELLEVTAGVILVCHLCKQESVY